MTFTAPTDLTANPTGPNAARGPNSLVIVSLVLLFLFVFLAVLVGVILVFMRRRHEKMMAALNR